VKVAEDVALGLVSQENARSDYGVVCDGDGVVDDEATGALRAEITARRGPVPLFDRGKRFDKLLRAGDITLTISD